MLNKIKRLSGMTLIEVVLYLALFAMFFLVMVQFFFFLGDSNQLSGENLKIDRTMIYLSQHFEDTFKRGVSIDEGEDGTIFGDESTKLVVNVNPLPENQLEPTPSFTPVPTLAPTETPVPTLTNTPTLTPAPSLVPTATPTETPIPTATFTPTPTSTPTNTPTNTPTLTPTFTPTATFTPTPTSEPLPTLMLVGAASADASSVTMPPAIQAGDLMVVAAYRRNNTVPSVATDWQTIGTHNGNSSSIRVAYKIATSGSDTSGTWNNAQFVAIQVFRNHAGVGDSAINSAGTMNMTYPSLSLEKVDGTSWVAAFAGNDGATNLETPPAGMINVTSKEGTAGEITAHNTNGGVASWTNQIVAANVGDSWKAATVEIQQYAGVLGASDAREKHPPKLDNSQTLGSVLGEGLESVSYTLTGDGILEYNGTPITRNDLRVTHFKLDEILDDNDNLIGVKVTVSIESRADPSIAKEMSNNYLLKL